MKLVMDERFKHRLIGILVLTSITVLFAPILLKRPQSTELSRRVVIKLPPKPALPKVNIPQSQSLFKTSQVEIPSIPKVTDKLPAKSQIAKAESLVSEQSVEVESPLAVKNLVSSANHGVIGKKVALTTKPASTKKTVTTVQPKSRYAVQLAVFSQQANAVNLVKILKAKGFNAFFTPDKLSNKSVFRVLVGDAKEKQAAQVLQKQLASAVQIKGFIVPSLHTS